MTSGLRIDWTSEMDALLGTMSDNALAEQLGLGHGTVNKRRRKLGIPGFLSRARPIDSLLGTMPDRELSKRTDNRSSLGWRRRKLGIPSWSSQQDFSPRLRRQRMAKLPDTLTLEQWEFACEWFDDCCAYCGEEAFLGEDHLIPVSKGGPRTALNIIPACWECNNAKKAKHAHIWIYEYFGMSEGQQIVDLIVAYLTTVKEKQK